MRDQYTDVKSCYYCGEPASELEHVIPQAFIKHIRGLGDMAMWDAIGWYSNRLREVASCRECNSLLGAKYFDTVEERKAFVKQRLRVRYGKLLQMPQWTDHELGQLDGELQNFVIEAYRKKLRLQLRLRW